ncbi:inorganic phosphate transporter [Mycobacterium spongiae]|uniref:Phosphate transporter n=1 Tax=Mycobacterium spongiae TaxID=886343 RepID=A0A975JYK3_9MYCO|nr:inorganic phosphate transporter [Mycobacterium spongiae]QUR68087.1 phosphate permease [Mycobacterium spongiae]
MSRNRKDHRDGYFVASGLQNPTTPTPQYEGFLGPDRRWHLSFGFLLAGSFVLFSMWAFDYVGSGANKMILLLATVVGLFMAFNVGGNDVANSFGTSVGAGTLTMKQALLVAAIFEVSGAVVAGGDVTETIRSGIVDLSGVSVNPSAFMNIMMSALLAAALWLLFANRMGYPVSTTHSIVGGIVGAAITLGIVNGHGSSALNMVQWDQIGQIAVSWVLSPVLGGLVSYILYGAVKRHILLYNEQAEQRLLEIKKERLAHRQRHKAAFERLNEIQQIAYTGALARDAVAANRRDFDPEELESEYYRELHEIDNKKSSVDAFRALQNWVPLVAAGGSMIIAAMLLFKGFKHMHLGLTTMNNYFIMAMVGAAVWMATFILAKTLRSESLSRSTFLMFSWMQVFTASGFAFSHGSNDIANAIGPFAAILDVLRTGAVEGHAAVPAAAMITFGVALCAGLWFIGRRVIATVGHNLTTMHPASGFAAELSAAAVVMGATVLGLPVSSTHILIGAVLGVGMVNRATNWGLMKPIALAWIITLPSAAILGSVGLVTLDAIF